jgi:hypothetical protein
MDDRVAEGNTVFLFQLLPELFQHGRILQRQPRQQFVLDPPHDQFKFLLGEISGHDGEVNCWVAQIEVLNIFQEVVWLGRHGKLYYVPNVISKEQGQ